jgi:hypothetical protein
LGIVARLGLGGRDVPDRLEEALRVEPGDPFEGGELHLLRERQGPRRRITSVLNNPITVSASALSYESPTLPTDGLIPASSSRSVYRMLTYCDPLSLWHVSLLFAGRRSCRACSRASRTKPVCAVRDTRQPTMRRAKTSMTKAT